MGFCWISVLLAAGAVHAAEYSAPAGIRPVIRRPGGPSIIPGGRIVAPMGGQYETGPSPLGLAVSPDGRRIVTCNRGAGRFSLTVLERNGNGNWTVRHLADVPPEAPEAADADGRLFLGLAFSGEHSVYASEGNTGRVRLVDVAAGDQKRTYDLNEGGVTGSYAGDLAFERGSGMLYVVDPAHSRVVSIDVQRRRIVSSTPLAGVPSALALSPSGRKAYVTIEGSLCVLDLKDPAAPAVETTLRGAGSPGVLAAAGRVFVSNGWDDSITVIDAGTNAVIGKIELRIPGLENLRGVWPAGMAYDEAGGRLLVAEAGINAVGVIDVARKQVLGHLPAAWFPTRVVLDRGTVAVTSVRGQGTGPSEHIPTGEFPGTLERGSVSMFPMPDAAQIAAGTATVLETNGFQVRPRAPAAYPSAIRYVVLILKEDRTFDEIFGDVAEASNGGVAAMDELARFGRSGWAYGGRDRFSVKSVNVTPNHHALAARWSFSDNYYAGSDLALESVCAHLERGGVSLRRFGEDEKLTDQERAAQFIEEIERNYGKGGQPLPRFLFLYLPGDRMDKPRPEDGYPYEASYVAGNDYATGRVIEYLSHTSWWREMAVFITEADTDAGVDHVDARRSILLAAGPYCRRNYVSHVHAGFSGLLKTIFGLLGAPPMNLLDAAASDLRDCFTDIPDYTPYKALPEDPRLFAPKNPRARMEFHGESSRLSGP